MMPRSIDDQPGDLPGEGGEKVPRAVRYLLDGYGRENVKSWTDDDCLVDICDKYDLPPIVQFQADMLDDDVKEAP